MLQNNYTDSDPFTVNRGVENKDALGNTTSFKKLRVTKYWTEKECNLVSGTDSITWAPMTEKLPFVSVYEPNVCRYVQKLLFIFFFYVIINNYSK